MYNMLDMYVHKVIRSERFDIQEPVKAEISLSLHGHGLDVSNRYK